MSPFRKATVDSGECEDQIRSLTFPVVAWSGLAWYHGAEHEIYSQSLGPFLLLTASPVNICGEDRRTELDINFSVSLSLSPTFPTRNYFGSMEPQWTVTAGPIA